MNMTPPRVVFHTDETIGGVVMETLLVAIGVALIKELVTVLLRKLRGVRKVWYERATRWPKQRFEFGTINGWPGWIFVENESSGGCKIGGRQKWQCGDLIALANGFGRVVWTTKKKGDWFEGGVRMLEKIGGDL